MTDTPNFGWLAHGMWTPVATAGEWFTYGGAWWRGHDHYGFSCGDSYPGHGREWCTVVKTMCCEVALINKAHNEPLLASLCRNQDGTIAKGYVTAVRLRYGDAEANTLSTDAAIQAHANAEMRKCWTFWARWW